MKKILLLTCMLLQLFCLDGMAMKSEDMKAMGLPNVPVPEILALSSLKDDEVQYKAEWIPINDIKRGAGKDTPLFYNGQEAQFQLKFTKIEGDNTQVIENPEEDGWKINWVLSDKPFKPDSVVEGKYYFHVEGDSRLESLQYSLKVSLEKEQYYVPFQSDIFVSKYEEPKVIWGDPIRYVELAKERSTILEIGVKDGNKHCWKYEWKEDGIGIIGEGKSCEVKYGDKLMHTISLHVENYRKDGANDPWYEEDHTYQVIFREEYELALTAKGKPEKKEWNVLSGKEVDLEYLLKNVTQDELVQNPEGDEEGWKADWNIDPQPEKVGQTSYKFTPTYKGTGEYSDETLKLTLTNEEKSPKLNDFLVFHVYPEPSIETNKKDVESGNPYDAGKEVKLEVIPKGGFRWKYSWKEGEESTDCIDRTYTVKFDGAFTRTITVTATNVGPEGELWLNETFEETFIIQFKQPGEYEIVLSTEKHHVLEGKEALINVQLKKYGEETDEPFDWVKEKWNPTWDPTDAEVINNDDGTFTFIPKYSDGEEQKLILTLENDNYAYEKVPTQEITFNVYPKPTATQKPDSEITATIGRPVELKIHTEGGYDDGWSFEWTDNNVLQKDVIGDTYIIEDNGTPERIVTVKVKNFGPDKDLWCEKDFTFNVTFKENPFTVLFDPLDGGMDVLDGKEIPVTFKLWNKDKDEEVQDLEGWVLLSAEPEGRVKSGDGPFSCIFTPKYDEESHAPYSTDVLALTFENKELDAFATGSLEFHVYPIPSAEQIQKEIKANIGEAVTLEVDTKGGNPDGWIYIWQENDEKLESDSSTCIIPDNGETIRTIQVTVYNIAPNSDEKWYPETTFVFTISYNNPYTIELETDPEGLRDVLDGDIIKVTPYLNDDLIDFGEGWQIKLSPEDRFVSDDDGTIHYDADGTFYYIAKYEGDQEPFEDEITLTLSKNDVEIANGSIKFNVYKQPKAEKYPNDKEIYATKKVPLRINTTGGYPDGWTFEWAEGDKKITEENVNVIEVEDNGIPERTIRVTVTNKGPKDKEWYGPQVFEFKIVFNKPVSYVVEFTNDEEHVLDGSDVQLTFTLYKIEDESRSEVKDLEDWTLTWDPEDLIQEKGGKYYFTAQYQGDNEFCEQPVTLTLQNDGFEVSDTATFVIWPQPVIVDGQEWMDAAEFKDLNNPLNKLQKGIRAGNKLELPEDTPDVTITYEWEGYDVWKDYEWKYVWSVDGKEYEDFVDIPMRSSEQYNLDIICIAQYSKGKDIMWQDTVGVKTLHVYKMPPTPTYFAQKGNGTSNTWFVNDYMKDSPKDKLVVATYKVNSDQTDVKVVSENVNVNISATDVGWFILEGHRDATDLCVYTVRDYGDNVLITSDILPVNKTATVKWDGSTYEGNGRQSQSAPSVTGMYSIDGVKTNNLVRGLNIIRLEDGTVRKVFKK